MEAVKRASIYGLFDSGGSLRYVGKANNPEKRLSGHMRESRRRNTPLYAWIRKYGKPEMRVLEESCENWQEAERRHIREAVEAGAKLLNLAEGGIQPYCSKEQRSRNAKALNARMEADPTLRAVHAIKRNIANGLRPGLVRNETREKLREAARRNPRIFGCWEGLPDREEA